MSQLRFRLTAAEFRPPERVRGRHFEQVIGVVSGRFVQVRGDPRGHRTVGSWDSTRVRASEGRGRINGVGQEFVSRFSQWEWLSPVYAHRVSLLIAVAAFGQQHEDAYALARKRKRNGHAASNQWGFFLIRQLMENVRKSMSIDLGI